MSGLDFPPLSYYSNSPSYTENGRWGGRSDLVQLWHQYSLFSFFLNSIVTAMLLHWPHWQISSVAFRRRHKVLISSLILKGKTVKTMHCPYAWHKKGIFVTLILVWWKKISYSLSVYTVHLESLTLLDGFFCNGHKTHLLDKALLS